ncbi:MAG: PIN domain-containing protein [Candidatus Nanoarchaeia archaeon]|nr:PIN domain-containing protein [Candidatus Nanoarchaeia archaeon]
MNLVVDANILFSALIKDNLTARLLFDERFTFYTPEYILEEFARHEKDILEKTHRSKPDFIEIMKILKELIIVFPKEYYREFMAEAEKICPDKDDTMYFALAIKLKCGIWSNDKKLKEQEKVRVYSTQEILLIA